MVHTISPTVVDLNQKTYQRLKSALELNLRRQIFIAICDNIILRDRLVADLEEDLSGHLSFHSTRQPSRRSSYPQLVTLHLNVSNPDPIAQISQWLRQYPPPINRQNRPLMPAFQLVGIEQLSRESASVQWLFLNHLRSIEPSLPALESSLLLWVTRPWSRMIPQSAKDFWYCRTAEFDFLGEPTPVISQPERFPMLSNGNSSPITSYRRTSTIAKSNQANRNGVEAKSDRPSNRHSQHASSGSHAQVDDAPIITPTADDQGADETKNDEGAIADTSNILAPQESDQSDRQDAAPQATIHHFTIPLDATLEHDRADADEDTWLPLSDAPFNPDTSVPSPPTGDELAETLAELTTDATAADPSVRDPWGTRLDDDSLDTPAIAAHFDLEDDEAESPSAQDFEAPSLPDDEPVSLEQQHEQADDTPLTDSLIPLELDAESAVEEPVGDRTTIEDTDDNEELPIFTAESSFLDGALSSDPSLGFSVTGQSAAQRSWLDSSMAEAFQSDLAADDPQAHALVQQLERLHQQKASANVMAGAYRSLGNLYRDRIEQGNVTPKNLLRAMKAYEHVMQLVKDDSPVWSEVLNDIGNLCWLLSRCAPAPEQGLPHLQQGIQAYRMALTKITPQTHPQTYPMIQNNLGAAYGDLARYRNPFDNLQRSVKAYQEALRYRRADVDPMRFASTQNNLGTTYWNLAQYREPVHNLKQAIAAYSQALSYYQPEKDALNYAMIQNNLGTAYWNLAQHDHAKEWLQSAISAYTIALEYRTLDVNPVAYAATQNNLGTAYWHISGYHPDQVEERLAFLRQAIYSYTEALKAADLIQQSNRPVALNFDVLATCNNLGLVQYQLASDHEFMAQDDKESRYLEQSLSHHVKALQGWQGRPDLRQTALKCVTQTLKAIYTQKGLMAQNQALSNIPGQLLPEILPQL